MLAACGWAVALAALLAGAAAHAALARQRELVARAVHEVRGPLTALSLGLGLEACELGLGPAAHGALSLELGRARLALDDLTRTRSGPAHRRQVGPGLGRLERVDVALLVADCVAAARPLAEAAGVVLAAEDPRERAVVWGDRLRLAQAVGNLIANAIEHGGGEVAVRLRLGPAHLRIEVSDSGPGLPAPVAELARRPRAGRGARGRGLAIAGEIAKRHRGRVSAAPVERGARVVLELPLGAAGARAERPFVPVT